MSYAQSRNRNPDETLAQLLRGAWRAELPALSLSETQVRAALPAAVQGGCAALAYRRLRHLSEYTTLARETLRDEYMANGLRAAGLLYHLPRLIDALRDSGIEPLLFKGWAIARHYPELALRPMGDVDFFVPAADLASARDVKARLQIDVFSADWHTETQDQKHAASVTGRTLDELYPRAGTAVLGSTHVHVLSPEDHLHLLCMHFLRHGGWRPLWLCDIAVALETRPRDFDWALALGQGQTADWVMGVLGAAHQLLGAEIQDTPCAARAKNLPSWFVDAILQEWADPDPARHHPPDPIRLVWKRPRKLARALRGRWYNPIEASVMLGAPFDDAPRVWYQTQYWLRQGADFVKRPR